MTGKMLFAVLSAVLITLGESKTTKRGIFGFGYGNEFNGFPPQGVDQISTFTPNHIPPFPGPLPSASGPVVFTRPALPPVTSAEIASAIQDAKEASASVLSAQKRVQEAKEAVLHQQHVASEKEAQATLALQRTEAAAAIQRQEAKAAATSVVQAQQRLAHAKAEVAEKQRIAAAKEAHAAAIIQKSASAAAAHIQKTDHAAQKISAIHNSEASALKNVAISRDATLSAASAALQASAESDSHHARHASHISFLPQGHNVQYSLWG